MIERLGKGFSSRASALQHCYVPPRASVVQWLQREGALTLARVIFVDDEPSIRDMLAMHLRLAGHAGFPAQSAEEARTLLLEATFDIALLDVMLPGEDGFSLAEAFVQAGIPVLFLTAKTAVADRVRGLRLGADDYLLKPFEPDELLARMDAILRRTQKAVFEDGLLRVDYGARTAFVRGRELALTALEFELLALLTQNSGVALSRERLLAQVWGYGYVGETRTVDVHIQRLRAKLGADCIETVYKYGYRYAKRKDA